MRNTIWAHLNYMWTITFRPLTYCTFLCGFGLAKLSFHFGVIAPPVAFVCTLHPVHTFPCGFCFFSCLTLVHFDYDRSGITFLPASARNTSGPLSCSWLFGSACPSGNHEYINKWWCCRARDIFDESIKYIFCCCRVFSLFFFPSKLLRPNRVVPGHDQVHPEAGVRVAHQNLQQGACGACHL